MTIVHNEIDKMHTWSIQVDATLDIILIVEGTPAIGEILKEQLDCRILLDSLRRILTALSNVTNIGVRLLS